MTSTKQVRLGGCVLDRSRHVCAFFYTKDEEYRVLLPFFQEGIEQGDRAFRLVDKQHRAEHLQRLMRAGIDVAIAAACSLWTESRSWQVRERPVAPSKN